MTVVEATAEALDRVRWLQIAGEAADDLATDAVIRDRAGPEGSDGPDGSDGSGGADGGVRA
ncbi:hypothetical protein PH213_32075 [Streptomyces sp. SRF1]|uniref:hypothetical protein n=1 Tax=Streptomyces sp. SRF1 TaxID=1549642 RepID=UPI0025B06AF7|nr:hypothetical protein [Streptomyces sp. SRF1]MDN3059087.1 hypothetical protein [Streptomyces sp. SRF1]